ncbi:MAG TPA: lysylphosphatidylglycerol synthase transmembrane domain-containing protein [Candidatus Sulfotelmatobacter sp.]|nr:lysylphosphatidylglycerol synthase transmembrane domain-containing protein [Candidatus Sulfotelmatobacter sp.]
MKTVPLRLWAGFREHWVILLGLIAVAALILAVDPGKVAHALAGADSRAVVLMLPVVLVLYLLHGTAWWIALRGADAGVGMPEAVRVTIISQAFDLLPGGDLWRVPIVRSADGEPLEAGMLAATVVFDDLVYYFVLTFAMVPAAVRFPLLAILMAVALLPQVLIFTILLWSPVYDALVGRLSQNRVLHRFQPQLALLGPSFRRLMTPRTLIPVAIVDAACAILAISLFGLALAAVHAAGVGFQRVAFTYASGQVLSGLTVLPAALGIYEGMMTGLMAVQGVAPAAAAAAALLYRVINDVLMALLGLAVALVSEREHLKQLEHRTEPVVH